MAVMPGHLHFLATFTNQQKPGTTSMKTPKFYKPVIHFLAHHKKLSLILSHGGMHLAVLVVLTIVITVFSIQIHLMSKRDYVVTTYILEDTKDESIVTGLKFYSFPMSIKKDNLSYFEHSITAELQPTYTELEQLGLADITPYIHTSYTDKKLRFTKDYFEIWHSIINEVPDSLFYSLLYIPNGETRPQSMLWLNDSLNNLKARSKFYKDNYDSPNINECLATLQRTLPLKRNIAFNDTATEKNIRLVGYMHKVFGGYVTNNATVYEDSSITMIPLKTPIGLEITGSRPRISGHSFKFQGNFWGKHDGNPYYMGRLIFNIKNYRLDDNSVIVLDFTPAPEKASSVIAFDRIYPEPTEMFVNKVEYRGKKAVEQAIRSGIYIEARDVTEAYRSERLYVLYSVLLGTFIAFALDIIIQLIYKWRRLKDD